MRIKQTVTAALFLLCLAAGFALLGRGLTQEEGGSQALMQQVMQSDTLSARAKVLVAGAEDAANRDLNVNHICVQIFGAVERLLGRRVVRDADESLTVVKLDNGALQFVDLNNQYIEDSGSAAALADFAGRLEARGIPLLYVNAPQKIQRGTSPLPDGVTEYGNEMGNMLLATLESRGVAVFDLRPFFEAHPDPSGLFFKTDHHWNPDAALFAYGLLSEQMDDYGFCTDPEWLIKDNYDVKVYEDWFLGSQGKRVGSLYAGVDDFEWWTPIGETHFTLDVEGYNIHREGGWNETLLFPEQVETRDWFNANPYTLYSGGDYPLATIVNHDNPSGKDMVLIRDSMSCVLTPFLARSCHTLTTIDLRHFSGDLEETVAALDPTLVMVLYGVSNARSEEMFRFG